MTNNSTIKDLTPEKQEQIAQSKLHGTMRSSKYTNQTYSNVQQLQHAGRPCMPHAVHAVSDNRFWAKVNPVLGECFAAEKRPSKEHTDPKIFVLESQRPHKST